MDFCNILYGGQTPYSEPENAAISDKVLELKATLKAFLTFHSYGQLWMTPYGYTHDEPEHYQEMVK